MKQLIALRVNGEVYELLAEPRRILLDALRDDLGITGAKKACDFGNCGNCTVLVDGKPVVSCLILAVDAQGKEIITIEGLADGENLHPLQEAFIDHNALQCGYCTPGMILTAKALLDANPHPTEDDIREAISGVLCRCTGYDQIIEAIKAVAQSR
ncbi:(2Fe-2S)-binding protein [Chloroflexota bacterium]